MSSKTGQAKPDDRVKIIGELLYFAAVFREYECGVGYDFEFEFGEVASVMDKARIMLASSQ